MTEHQRINVLKWRHDNQSTATQHNDTLHNWLHCITLQKNTLLCNVIMRNVTMVSFIMSIVDMPSIVWPSVIKLSVALWSVMAPPIQPIAKKERQEFLAQIFFLIIKLKFDSCPFTRDRTRACLPKQTMPKFSSSCKDINIAESINKALGS